MNDSDTSIEDLKREVISVGEHNARLKTALRESKTQLESLRSQLRQIGQPPLSRAIFEGFSTDKIPGADASQPSRLAEVAWEGKHVRLAVQEFAGVDQLQPGDAVWIDSTPVVVGFATRALSGSVAVIRDLKMDRAVVRLSSGTEVVVRLRAGFAKTLKAGDTLLVDTRAG